MPNEALPRNNIQVTVTRRPGADRDRISAFIWSSRSSGGMVSAVRRVFSRRRLPETTGVRVELWYAESLAGSVDIAEFNGFAQLSFQHSGAHLATGAFSVRADRAVSNLRAVIAIEARTVSFAEQLASQLDIKPDQVCGPYPNCGEVLALRRALCR
jgi:hypothetical protein